MNRLIQIGCLLLLLKAQSWAQLRFSFDAGGNPTAITSGTAAPTTSATGTAKTLRIGDALSLSINVAGSGPLTYQWKLNGTAITGATGSTFFLKNVGASDAGTYTVVVSNSSGSITQTIAVVSILAAKADLFSEAYGNSKYVAVGNAGTIVTSSDLVQWTAPSSGTTNRLAAIIYANSKFVAVGNNGTILTSTDGATWTIRTSGSTNDLAGIAYGNSTFVAVGKKGTTLTSTDAISWTTQTFDVIDLNEVQFGNSKFVAVGTSGTIWTSSNGISWASHSWPTSESLTGVAYGNSKYVAVGSDGLILYSSDASTWAQAASPTGQPFQSLTFFNNTFYAFVQFTQFFASADGISWGPTPLGTFDAIYGSAIGNGNLIAIGQNGLVTAVSVTTIDHFNWTTISSPQRTGQAFSATVTARDAANNLLTGYNGTLTLSGVSLQSISTGNTILTSATANSYSTSGTFGYSFTPARDLTVTAFRTFFGSSVSLWTVDGLLLVQMPITNTAGAWSLNTLSPPLTLKAGNTYVLSTYTAGTFYLPGASGPSTFTDGTINEGFWYSQNAFPWVATADRWYMVDLQYTTVRNQNATVSPTSVTLASGTGTANISISSPSANLVLTASDALGHLGNSIPINVYAANDISISLAESADPVVAGSTLTYTVTVANSGSSSATGIQVTNIIPQTVSGLTFNASQGSTNYSSGTISWSVGTLASMATATLTINMTPTTPGKVLTNTASVTCSTDSNTSNNSVTATTYVLPSITVGNLTTSEGNIGNRTVNLTATISPPTPYAIIFHAKTTDGTATAGQDFTAVDTDYSIPPWTSTVLIPVEIHGDSVGETDEYFYLDFSSAINAVFSPARATVTISNDDDIAGQVDSFAWNTIASPQRTNTLFSATITAKDYLNSTATSFTGTNKLTAFQIGGSITNRIITNSLPTTVASDGAYTFGYSFTPTNDIVATHVRSFSGSKVSVWTDEGYLLTAQNVAGSSGVWTETELSTPILLYANQRYRVGFYTSGQGAYWITQPPAAFANGTINAGYFALGDAFPGSEDDSRWAFVDLRYSTPAALTPQGTGSFYSGQWSGNLSLTQPGRYELFADDLNAHIGLSAPFRVYQANDVAVFLSASTNSPTVGTNFTYTVTAVNAGPATSNGIKVTNTLPATLTLVSVSVSSGSYSTNGQTVTWTVGSLADLSSATMTLTVTPTVAGQALVNTASIYRNETDPDASNNSDSLTLTPNTALTAILADATDSAKTLNWRSYGNVLWNSETSVTHDGVDAVQSGAIGNSQNSRIETTVRGPGTVTFWWKVSSEATNDKLTFLANSNSIVNISGNVDWQLYTYTVPSGLVTLTWEYAKNASISSGSDAGWIDQVTYTVPAFNFSQPIITNNAVQLTLNGTNGQRLFIDGSVDLVNWTSLLTNTLSSSQAIFTDTQFTNNAYRSYRALHKIE